MIVLTMPLASLTFDPRIQPRPIDGDHAGRMAGLARRKKLRIAAVRDGKRFWAYGGFHAAEAYRRIGQKLVDVEVTDGAFEDAVFLSFGENSAHGLPRESGLPRSPADCFRIFERLVLSTAFRARVEAMRRSCGGLDRAIAKVTGISKGAVQLYKERTGITFDRATGKIVVPFDAFDRLEQSAEPNSLHYFAKQLGRVSSALDRGADPRIREAFDAAGREAGVTTESIAAALRAAVRHLTSPARAK